MNRIGKLFFEYSHALFDSKFSIKDMIKILSGNDFIHFYDRKKNECNNPKKVFYYSLTNKKAVIKKLTEYF